MCIRKTACLAIVCLLLTSLGVFCQTGEISPQTDKVLAGLVKIRPGLKADPKAIQKLVEKIICDNKYLADNFSNRNFIAVAERLGERGTSLLTPKYKKVCGIDSAGFWQASWNEKVKLQIVTIGIMVTDVVGRYAEKRGRLDKLTFEDVTYDLAAVVVQEFHVIEGGAPVLHNATGIGEEIYRHQDTCVWE